MFETPRHFGTFRIFALLLCALGWTGTMRMALSHPATTPPRILPNDGFNFELAEQLTPSHLLLTLTQPCHNWFAGTFTDLPVDHEMTLGFSMDGNSTPFSKANVTKWRGLRPLVTYADPMRYESFEWFRKDSQGCWMSGDPFKLGDARLAGTGVVPRQQVIPEERAAQFLTEEGTFWFPWRDVDRTEVLPQANIFRILQRFAYPTATVAMRVPCSYTYLQAYITRLQDAGYTEVTVDLLGTTPQGRNLHVIRIQSPPPEGTLTVKPTILVYAREHATEPDSSWVVLGLLNWLLSSDANAVAARRQANWLLIPLLDPDASANAIHKEGSFFRAAPPIMPEARLYATYLVEWLDAGNRLDVAVNLHNVECAEFPHLTIPIATEERQEALEAWARPFFQKAHAAGYHTGSPRGLVKGVFHGRLAFWCFARFSTFDIALEVNGRFPNAPLTLPRLQELGALLGHSLSEWTQSDLSKPIREDITQRLAERRTKQQAWKQTRGRSPDARTAYELFTLGY